MTTKLTMQLQGFFDKALPVLPHGAIATIGPGLIDLPRIGNHGWIGRATMPDGDSVECLFSLEGELLGLRHSDGPEIGIGYSPRWASPKVADLFDALWEAFTGESAYCPVYGKSRSA